MATVPVDVGRTRSEDAQRNRTPGRLGRDRHQGKQPVNYTHGNVRLSASPDLAVQEGGRLKLVKLGTTKKGASPELVRIMLRVMYQAAIAEYQVQPHDVAYFDVTNAVRMKSSVDDCDLATTIDNGCNTLAGMV